MPPADRSLLDFRLVVVTGKGGVGKTAVACALAEAARSAGQRVLLAETAPVEAIAARFETDPAPLGYEGRTLRPNLHAMRIDPHEALADYVRLQTRMGLVTDRMLQSTTFREMLDAAPGWRELIILGKIWHLEQARDRGGRPRYDLIVIDAPATGHGLTFLDVPRVVQRAIHTGPLMRHAGWVEALVHDRERTLLLPVTLAEDLPVSETIELVARARDEIDIGIDRVVVNRVPAPIPSGLEAATARLPAELDFEALPPRAALERLVGHAATRGAVATAQRARVSRDTGLPVVDLPTLAEGFGGDAAWTRHAGRILAAPAWPAQAEAGADAA